jgi:hypothetical protein
MNIDVANTAERHAAKIHLSRHSALSALPHHVILRLTEESRHAVPHEAFPDWGRWQCQRH